MTNGRSQLASVFYNRKDKTRTVPVHGVVVHTTGSGVVTKAREEKGDPQIVADDYYRAPTNNGAHYTIGYAGFIHQIADENVIMAHAGIANELSLYRDGSWTKKVSPKTLKLWKYRWGMDCKSPLDWLPGPAVNNHYIGVELVPLMMPDPEGYIPAGAVESFTVMQYESLSGLLNDIAARWPINYGKMDKHPFRSTRLVGHEDINPVTRSDKGGGWDPGFLRDTPRFHWSRIWSRL